MTLPAEARDGLMRAWLAILRERHPGTQWIVKGNDERDPCGTEARTPHDR